MQLRNKNLLGDKNKMGKGGKIGKKGPKIINTF